LSLEKKLTEREAALLAEKEQAVKAVQSEYKQKENAQVVRSQALSILDELKPVLPGDASKATRLKDLFLKDVLAGKYEVSEDGKTIILLKEDGTRAEDEHGNAIEFVGHVKSMATQTFDFQTSTPRSAPANGSKNKGEGNEGGKGGNKQLPKPKDFDELAKILDDPQYSVEERTQIHADFEKAHA
jgi:hypothetical protein